MNWIIKIISISATINLALACNRIPVGTTAGKSPADDRYVVTIGGNPQNFEPGQKYNISLTAVQGYAFIGFMLAVEVDGNSGADPMRLGYFEIVDFSETKFSDKCNNLVMQTNMLPKSRVNVVWTAPPPGSGCVLIRATVIEHREVWYMDDGFLTKQFCEEQQDDIDNQPAVMDPCCACDEAKYELTFEGKWSRHTHPKDFPANSWRTRFSDIIGASHTIDYRFWRYGEQASEGLKEVAEHGSTRTLESELKEQSDQIRTIIKARGIAYPNVTGKTFAVFRVDSKNHLISLVSMIDPSPDWIVGVSGLELCLPNCSWVEYKVHNLYPWDTGTDGGPSYMSADQPQVPPDVIRRIKSNFPNDPRSPFYDPSGAPMKPLARLHISRRRLYEKNCENNESENDPVECSTHPWGRWSECSTKCGPGEQYRTREFKNPGVARRYKCRNSLREEQSCQGTKCGGFDEDAGGGGGDDGGYSASPENPECALSDWSEWSSCSVTCGRGVRTQSRTYLNRRAKKKCQSVSRVILQRNEKCEGVDCGGDIGGGEGEEGEQEPEEGENENPSEGGENEENIRTRNRWGDRRGYKSLVGSYGQQQEEEEEVIPPQCNVAPWSSWSPCSETCGEGFKTRERQVWNNDVTYGLKKSNYGNDPCQNIKKQEIVNCTISHCDTIVPDFCFEEPEVGPCRGSDVTTFWYYDSRSKQCALFFTNCYNNRNKFNSSEKCEETCKDRDAEPYGLSVEDLRLEKVDCVVSEWVAHSCNATCGDGVEIKTRKVLRSPKHGGKPCPRRLIRMEKCYKHCPEEMINRQRLQYTRPPENECRYSDWSPWSPCTATCGSHSVRQQTRVLINTELSYKCRERVRIEKCIVMPCLISENCRGPYC
ncbi:spondin-1 [Episyrphus balteatus]|uniref:spondin-1 n=1 Tax=Episyrphus balteatus TaxID=286459 RepID=UPI00248564FC|nr:spondin-1 [Episyrphus balteatus]